MKFGDKWKHFKRAVEIARGKGESYFALADIHYCGKKPSTAFPILIERLKTLKHHEINDYFDIISTNPDSESVKSNGDK